MTIRYCLVRRSLALYLAIAFCALFTGVASATDAGAEELQYSKLKDTASQRLLPFEVTVPRTAHFSAPDGAAVVVAPGVYGVGMVDDTQLHLIPERGESFIVAAQQTEHEEGVSGLTAISEQVGDDEFHIVLLLPDAVALDADATFSGITTRATRTRIMRKDQIRLASMRYKRPARTAAAVNISSEKNTATQQYVAPGSTATYRFEVAPEVNAYGARLVDPRTRHFVPPNVARASVERRTEEKQSTTGQTQQVPVVEVTVTSSRQLRYGDYQLWLLDRNGRPLTKSATEGVSRPARIAPIRVTAVAGNHPALQQQATKVAVVADQSGRTQFSGQVADPARELNRANQVMDQLGRVGLDGMPGLEPGSLAGSGLLMDFGEDLRNGFVNQLGGFPEGEFEGLLEGVAGGQTSGSLDSGRFQPDMSNPSKDSSLLEGGATLGDSRLMSGGSGSGGTFTITSSMTDVSSNGNQKVTETIDVEHDDGSSFHYEATSETREDGSSTETQTATRTDENGNTTSETTTTETDSEGNSTTTTASTDKDGKTTTETETKTASDPASTPNPEGGEECTDQACQEFMAFTNAFFGALRANRIENKGKDPESLMQPSEDTSTPGSFSQAELDRMSKERLNPYILHDNAGDSSIPMPAGTGTRPVFDVKDSLTDPPRDMGTSPPGGTMPIRRSVPVDTGDGAEDSSESNEKHDKNQ